MVAEAPPLSSEHLQIHNRLKNDLNFYARHALNIKTKEGDIKPFVFNSAQEYLHAQLEKQRSETGMVRVIIVKGRQQGCSTYIAARGYHRAGWNLGQSIFILSHEAETTKKLFKMVERYYELTPAPIKPPAKVANRREFIFSGIDSDYSVGTAGNQQVGRGGTIQFFHGSEVAFWEHTDELQTGILQSIPDSPDTEIILESTANGMGNMFYNLTMDAVAGKNQYRVVFIPWYWQDEYSRTKPHDQNMELSDEEKEYKGLYDLTNEQMYWRRGKIAEFKSEWKFKQEYPAFLLEAFQTSGDTLIDAQRIIMARKSKLKDEDAPLVMGVDPGRNKDRTVFAYRKGRELLEPEVFKFGSEDTVQMQIAGTLVQRIKERQPQKVYIDVGHGYGVLDRITELGYGQMVEGINFGSQPIDREIYLNKRAEMWCLLRDWLHGEDGEVSIPDMDDLQRDLMLTPGLKTTSSGKIQLVGKDKIRADTGFSPDIGDACALTFAFPVQRYAGIGVSDRIKPKKGTGRILKTLQRTGKRRNIRRIPRSTNSWS